MNNYQNSRDTDAVTRRSVLAGSAAAVGAVVLSSIPTTGIAMPMVYKNHRLGLQAGKARGETTLAKYLCESVHEKIAIRLDAIIADPAIDGEQTALALMEARCPGCKGRVHPATSSLSAVIPQWKKPAGYGNPCEGATA